MVDVPIGPHRPHAVTELLPGVGVTQPRQGRAAARAPAPPRPALSDHAEVYSALVLGTRDYLRKNGFTEAVIGLSGGIDSSLVATIAVDALGAERVHGLSMPSRYSSEGSRHDAGRAGRSASASISQVVPIEAAHVAFAVHAGPGARAASPRPDRREPAVAPPRRAAHGRLERQGVDRADHGQQERDGHRVLHALRRLRRWVRGDQGRAEDARVRPVPLPQRPGGLEGLPGPIPDSVLDKPPSAELRPEQRDDQSSRPTRSSTRCSRPTWSAT